MPPSVRPTPTGESQAACQDERVTTQHTWTDYAQKTIRHEPSRPLQYALKLISERPPRLRTALDLGCGAGNEVMALLERGWQVTALDIDGGVLDRLRERASNYADHLTLAQGEFHRMPRRKYGLIYASRSLPFATPEEWQKAWRTIANNVAVNGIVVALLFGNEDELLPAGRRVLVNTDEARALLPGFEIISLREHRGEGRRVRDGSTYHSHELVLAARKVKA